MNGRLKIKNMTQFLPPSTQKGFSSSAELYQQVRPSYPQNIVYWLKNSLTCPKKVPSLI